jgi:hypothetical protein
MPALATASPAQSRYLTMFPCWEGRRPLRWFFAEQFLEARAQSAFPTGCMGPDEDVNLYIIDLLARWASTAAIGSTAPGADPLFLPPDRALGRRQRAEERRRQADHRLLALGLFDRGDLVRRRKIGWRMTAAETRARDLTVMVRSYQAAADLLDRRPEARGLTEVWRKLADQGPEYVGVLQALARRRLGLGARLNDAELAHLLGPLP